MLKKLKNTWKTNPYIILGSFALIIALFFILWSSINRAFSYLTNRVKGVGSSLSLDEAKSVSSTIYSEVNSSFTDEDVIVGLVQTLSLSDFYKVEAVFGIQPYSDTFDNFDSLTGVNSNLTQVLNQTLSKDDKEKIKNTNPSLPIS